MIRLLVLLALLIGTSPIMQASKPATICEPGTEWVPEISDCAVVVYDQDDIDLTQAQQKAEDIWAKIQSWYADLKSWKETCFSPVQSHSVDANAPKGIIKVLDGSGTISRGLEIITAEAGIELKPGDIITLDQGSSAELDLRDTGVLKINSEARFLVPNTDKKMNVFQKTQHWAGGIWNRVKRCTHSPIQLKDGSVGGVRG